MIKTVRLHEHPDLDAICAYMLCYEHEEAFPGIRQAKVEFVPQGPPVNGKTADELENDGILHLDCGEGRFDHHPAGANGGPFDKCATYLVAEHLDKTRDLALKRLLGYVQMHDLEGPTSFSQSIRVGKRSPVFDEYNKAVCLESFQLSAILSAQRRLMRNSTSLVRWGRRLLGEMYRYQSRFWNEVKTDYRENAKIWMWYHPPSFTDYRIVTIESSEREVGAFSRTKDGGRCKLCVHRMMPKGNVFISGFLTSEQFLEIRKFLLVWEMQARSIGEHYRLEELEEAKMLLCPHWYAAKNKDGDVYIVMNGSEKVEGFSEIEPTCLTMKQIENAVVLGLSNWWYPNCCPKTHCESCRCSWYPYGLKRCQQIRDHTPSQ